MIACNVGVLKVMLEYSGILLHGLRAMGLDDVIDNLKRITCDERYNQTVEWLGCPWSHAVAPSTAASAFSPFLGTSR